jgi:hypothetical protein
MEEKVRGCGQSNTPLTLYHVTSSGKVRTLSRGFERLACGNQPSTFETHSYGVLLCNDCSQRLGFPQYTESR